MAQETKQQNPQQQTQQGQPSTQKNESIYGAVSPHAITGIIGTRKEPKDGARFTGPIETSSEFLKNDGSTLVVFQNTGANGPEKIIAGNKINDNGKDYFEVKSVRSGDLDELHVDLNALKRIPMSGNDLTSEGKTMLDAGINTLDINSPMKTSDGKYTVYQTTRQNSDMTITKSDGTNALKPFSDEDIMTKIKSKENGGLEVRLYGSKVEAQGILPQTKVQKDMYIEAVKQGSESAGELLNSPIILPTKDGKIRQEDLDKFVDDVVKRVNSGEISMSTPKESKDAEHPFDALVQQAAPQLAGVQGDGRNHDVEAIGKLAVATASVASKPIKDPVAPGKETVGIV